MGELIRAMDWSRTPIGAMDTWSPSLRMMVRFLLANRFPLLLWWGPEYVSIYNDPYRPILGAKHPWALGTPVSECWSEIWHILQPLIDTPFRGGPATWNDDIFLEINRHGFLEETHFTIAYSPVPDDTAAGGIGGVLATVHEITDKVVAERRVVALRDLGARVSEAKTTEEACATAAHTLSVHAKDVPFALLYLIDEHGRTARLAGAAGIEPDTELGPRVIELDTDGNHGWPVELAMESERVQMVDLRDRFAVVPQGPWADRPTQGITVVIPSTTAHKPAGLLMAGASARLELDDYYLAFFELVRTQIATAIANAGAHEEERRRVEALAELDRAKTAFFSNVSHEFRTPLTLILGPMQDALDDPAVMADPAARERIATVHRNALRLQKLVNTLLDFSRIEAGRVQASYVPVDLSSLTAELVSNFRSACDRAGVGLVVDCPPLSQPVYVDRDMWEKIVLNLVSNACKFTLEGQIEVTLREHDGRAELRVHDTGVGIPAGEMPKIFERFHRVEGTAGRSQEGSGIGLALVRELAKLHGGDVRAESEPGRGSTFTVSIPLGRDHLPADRIGAVPSAASTAVGAQSYVEEALRWLPDAGDQPPQQRVPADEISGEPAAANAARPRVLIADDNADLRQYLVRLLGRKYTVTAVANGEDALQVARASHPDLIVSDVMMPRVDGFELLQRIRGDEATSGIPFILLSARAGEESRIEGLEAGADDYLVKPFSARELLASVKGQLRLASLRRESREALRESEQRFRTMADTAPAMLWVTEASGACSFVSRSWCDYTGQSFENALGYGWLESLHPEDRERAGSTFLQANAHHTPFSMDYRVRRKDGDYRWAIANGRPRFADDATFTGFIGSVMDVHERKDAEEALRLADRRKNEFLAMLAHELRNPLAPIRNAVQIIKHRRPQQPELQWATGIIDRQIAQMSRLVDDLMDVARITRGKIELRRDRVLLADVVKDAIEASRPLIDECGHTLTVSMPPEAVVLFADRARLSQVVLNLLNNAARYTETGGTIHLGAHREEDHVVIQVKDNGVGIPADVLPRIFGLFAQDDRTPEMSRGGLGLGLTLVQRLVDMHGGSVDARSAGRGQGSEFTVRLPVLEGAVMPQPADEADTPAGGSLRILVVDDVADSANTLAMYLRMSGHEVQTASDGMSAVDRADAFQPDVAILDIGLPKLNGYDAAKEIRSRLGSRVVLVALTGWGQEEDRRLSREAGFNHHMTKPVDFDQLGRLLADAHAATSREAGRHDVAELNDKVI
ncbi:MAG TPA: ATP-binding protein [Candidatus Krumholzibacteria bacterium]